MFTRRFQDSDRAVRLWYAQESILDRARVQRIVTRPGSRRRVHTHTCKAARQPAMGQNLIRLVEKMMLDGCLDESTKARYQSKSPYSPSCLPTRSLPLQTNLLPSWVGILQDHLHRRRGQVAPLPVVVEQLGVFSFSFFFLIRSAERLMSGKVTANHHGG
jgi:hypothetical protein